MKYLRKYSCREFHYNESNSEEFIIQELEDIALELTDEGFTVDVTKWVSGILIRIYKRRKAGTNNNSYRVIFPYLTIKETTERMERYLQSEGQFGAITYIPSATQSRFRAIDNYATDILECRLVFSKNESEIQRILSYI